MILQKKKKKSHKLTGLVAQLYSFRSVWSFIYLLTPGHRVRTRHPVHHIKRLLTVHTHIHACGLFRVKSLI